MRAIQSIISLAAITVGLSAPASAGLNDPEIIIYRFTGVRDDGGAQGFGLATAFECTNFSGAVENLRFVTRDVFGELKTNVAQAIFHLGTVTMTTHGANGISFTANLATGAVSQGSTAIAATSANVLCGARTIDATGNHPFDSVPLPRIRFNPVPGSQE
jgi:hypothetical protein